MNTIAVLILAAAAIAVALIPRESLRLPWRRRPDIPMLKVRLGLKPIDGQEQATLEGYTRSLQGPLITLVSTSVLQAVDGREGDHSRTELGGRVVVPISNLLFAQVLSE